nr:unnamed protein product [Spirometra erinaceieuropaei]
MCEILVLYAQTVDVVARLGAGSRRASHLRVISTPDFLTLVLAPGLTPATLINTAHSPDTSSNINTTAITSEVRTRIAPALTATAPSPHTSGWSVTCESIAQRLTNQCLEHPPTPPHLPPLSTLPSHFHASHDPIRPHNSRESGIDRSPDTPTTPSLTLTSSPCASTTNTPVTNTDTTDFSCHHCPRTFTSRIGLVGHLRVHRTETGEPVPEAPTATAFTVQAHSCTARVDSATCASKKTCGRQPPATPHHQTLPHSLSTISSHIKITHHKHSTVTSQASGKCASPLGIRAAPVAWVTRAWDPPDASSVIDRKIAD